MVVGSLFVYPSAYGYLLLRTRTCEVWIYDKMMDGLCIYLSLLQTRYVSGIMIVCQYRASKKCNVFVIFE